MKRASGINRDFPLTCIIYTGHFSPTSLRERSSGLIKPPGDFEPSVKEDPAEKEARGIEKSPDVTSGKLRHRRRNNSP